jgi:CheY-like chemotaxis protein
MLKGKTLLLVDDDDRNIIALAAILKSKRPIILIAKDGIECLEKIRQHPEIDLVLLDMMMPVMDGYEALKQMRIQPATLNLPVIALTAMAMQGDKQKCLDAGANAYCSKPVDLNILLSQMKQLLMV